MKTSQYIRRAQYKKGFIAPILLAIIAVLAIGGVAYVYLQKKQINQPLEIETPAQASPTAQTSNDCRDFNAFSQIVLSNIEKPDSQNTVNTSFRWKRSAGEPFVSYPTINGIEISYGDIPASVAIARTDFMAATKNNSNSLNQNLAKEAAGLGLTNDELNTLPFRSFDMSESEVNGLRKDFSYFQVFGFKKGTDLYRVVLSAQRDYQAPGQGTVTITCGRALDQYDNVYSALKFKSDPTMQNPYYDYVAIRDVSPDGTVYALLGSTNHIKIGDYYYFNGNTTKLASTGSYPAQCSVLEAQKVGLGMRCVGISADNIQRTVTYTGSQSMAGLNRLNFLVVSGKTPLTRGAPALGIYFYASIGTDLRNGNKEGCSIDFGDGHTSPLFKGADCSNNSISSGLFHAYDSTGTYTAKIIGSWHDIDTNEQRTEILAETTVTITN